MPANGKTGERLFSVEHTIGTLVSTAKHLFFRNQKAKPKYFVPGIRTHVVALHPQPRSAGQVFARLLDYGKEFICRKGAGYIQKALPCVFTPVNPANTRVAFELGGKP
ncbi:MAG: hypothetical protein H0Z34_05565 [Brevibacillus sp.]|nr:hypothetical protein [Brevibacillus sp.]